MSYRYLYGFPCHRPPTSNGDNGETSTENTINSENTININTTINLTQNANANAGDGGNGGETSDLTGGSASSASATDGCAIAFNGEIESESDEAEAAVGADADVEADINSMGLNNSSEQRSMTGIATDLGLLTDKTASSADAGDANGTAGSGGNGGNTGNAGSNNASIISENVVVISTGANGAPPALSLGLNGRSIDITTDENGNTLVNGQSMTEETLRDGTKVFIFRNNDVKS